MNSANYNAMMAELREEYLASFDEKFNLMKNFLEGQDWYSLELEMHKLKGTGSTYGVPEVTELCQHMETVCREQGSIPEDALDTTIAILKDIRKKYTDNKDFDLSSDSRFAELKKL